LLCKFLNYVHDPIFKNIAIMSVKLGNSSAVNLLAYAVHVCI